LRSAERARVIARETDCLMRGDEPELGTPHEDVAILAALDGEYGDHHPTKRTLGSELWINPLMSLLWSFQVEAIARRCQYLDEVKTTTDLSEIAQIIRSHRQRLGRVRPWKDIPV